MTKSGLLFLFVLAFASLPSFGQDTDGKTVVIKTRCVSTAENIGDPLFVIFLGELKGEYNSKEIGGGINPDQIKEMKVLRTPEAVAEYGEAGKNGVILIWLKDESLDQLPKSMVEKLSKTGSSYLNPL
ncbi:hypothetical protein Aoki45_24850 [Algoriphagus sp. oki45]|uniref:hypothetical protein n=1 Tax=Algoriphagus sp. oki45 TaxID=3067294 RepID=UPI0027ED9759|nr:hypothetical protein Aoki45_24850 [Algoriphagus sp. oki45]